MKKTKILNIQKKHTSRFLYLIYGLLSFFVLYHLYYSNKIIPGVVVGNVDLGGLNIDQAYNKLQQNNQNNNSELNYTYQDKTYTIDLKNTGFSYDLAGTINNAYQVGRTDNIIVDTKNKLFGFLKSVNVNAVYDYDQKSLENEILKLKGEFNKPYIDSKFYLDQDFNLKISDSFNGYKIIDEQLNNLIFYSLNNLDFSQQQLPVSITNPQITKSNIEPLFDKVQSILNKDFSVFYDSSSWDIDLEQKLDLIVVKNNQEQGFYLDINNATFNSFIDLIKYDVEILPKGKVQEDNNGNVVSFELLQSGTQIDEETFYNNFKSSFLDNDTNQVTVTTKVVDNFDIEKYGIYQLLGTGVSKYTGSGSTRVHNLTLAADRASGILVPPQGIYSLNKSIGAINASTGYQVGYIISGGRTVLGEGGGVCQTSTTLFRAVLNAGLPIVMRYAHDYRVSYYEIESSVGFDAAIFQPSLDFQFKNDTPNYILVQSSYDLEQSSLTFKIYGTSDGRSVEITEPIVTSYSPPPAPLYQEDSSLPKGVVRQVDWAAPGSNVSFSRTVTKDGEPIIEDTFISRYYPWRAVFLVGTGD